MRHRLTAWLLAAALVCTVGCARPDAPSELPPTPPVVAEVQPNTLDNIRVPWFENDTLNPYSCQTLQNYYLAGLLCDSLVALGAENTPQNRLALETGADKNNYIILLRHDAVFSDGSPLTAEDVIYSLGLAQGSPRFAPGLAGVEKAEAPDPGTVIITLKSPDIFFARSLTFPIVKKDTGELPVPVGVGRFLHQAQENTLVRNNKYYNPVKNVQQLSLVPTDSLEEQSFGIMEGKIDLMYSDLQGDLNLGLGIGYRQIPLSNMVYLGINGSGERFGASTAIRQALSGLIDRDEISRKVYMGFAASTSLPVNPSMAATTLSAADLEVNKEKQYEILRQAGYTIGEDKLWRKPVTMAPLRFELLVNEENDDRVAAAEIIARLYKDSGITLTVLPLPFTQYSERIAKGEYDLYIGEVRLAYNMNIAPLIFPGGTINPNAPSLPGLSAVYADVVSGKSEPALLEERLRTDLPVVPLLFRRGILCFSRDFSANIVATEQDIFYNITDW